MNKRKLKRKYQMKSLHYVLVSFIQTNRHYILFNYCYVCQNLDSCTNCFLFASTMALTFTTKSLIESWLSQADHQQTSEMIN